MTKRVQILGHDAAAANAFIGDERELTVDTENLEIRIHDGVTPGGHRVPNRDSNDNRYQMHSVELDGFLDWAPGDRGILTRLGPADYALRSLAVDAANLTITNANGFAENPTFGLKPTITSDHTWTGDHTFDQAIIAAGFIGPVTGNTSGTHTGPVIGNLTGNANGAHTGSFAGNLDVSGFGVNFDENQIPAAAVDGLEDALAGVEFPAGGIIMWSGDVASIPTGWFLCDGLNGTPDLRNRFIVGAGDDYAPLATGGTLTHDHTVSVTADGAHNHTGEVGDTTLTIAQMPAHTHKNGVTDDSPSTFFNRGSVAASPTTADSPDANNNDGVYEGVTSSEGGGNPHNHTVTIDSGGSHTHPVDADPSDHTPPYYALCFIMRAA